MIITAKKEELIKALKNINKKYKRNIIYNNYVRLSDNRHIVYFKGEGGNWIDYNMNTISNPLYASNVCNCEI